MQPWLMMGLVIDGATLIWLVATLSIFFYHVKIYLIGRKRDKVDGFSFWVSETRHHFCGHCWFIKIGSFRSVVAKLVVHRDRATHNAMLVFVHWLGRMEAATHDAIALQCGQSLTFIIHSGASPKPTPRGLKMACVIRQVELLPTGHQS